MIAKSLQQLFANRNRESQGRWAEFAEHRERLRQLLEQHLLPQDCSLCVLGAGNANDLDLQWMTSRFEKVTLVDLDLEAMQTGVLRQRDVASDRIEFVAADVTGLSSLIDLRGSRSVAMPSLADAMATQLENTFLPANLGSTFDVVVSTCLLSQLIDSVRMAVGESHQKFLPLVQGVRRQHLRTLIQLSSKQALVACVFDFVSSLTCPGIADQPATDLAAYAAQQINKRNFFTGLHPAFVRKSFADAISEEGAAGDAIMPPPWRWNLGSRMYLVSAALARLA